MISPRPQPPRQPGQDEGDEDGGEQVDGVVVQDGFPTDPLGGGRLVAHHLPDARVETCRQTDEEETEESRFTLRLQTSASL